MYFALSGKNIMKDYRLMTAVAVVLAIAAGCSKNESKKTPSASLQVPANSKLVLRPDATLKDTVEYTINKTFTLLKYGDKSGLFENEFSYITDGKTFDEYLKYGEVSSVKVESLTVVDVLAIDQFDGDSLKASVQVNFLGPSGKPTFIKDRITMYQQNGHWIKPIVGRLKGQLDYLKRMHEADSAADAEG